MIATKPDYTEMVRCYHLEVVQHGKRGAQRRAADKCGVSDESIRRAIAWDESQRTPLVIGPAELVYIPAPGERPVMPRSATQSPRKRHADRPRSVLLRHGPVRVRRGERLPRHDDERSVALPVIAPNDFLAPVATMSSEYEARQRLVKTFPRFEHPTVVRSRDLFAPKERNWKFAIGIVAAIVLVWLAFSAVHYTPVQPPLKDTFAPQVLARQ